MEIDTGLWKNLPELDSPTDERYTLELLDKMNKWDSMEEFDQHDINLIVKALTYMILNVYKEDDPELDAVAGIKSAFLAGTHQL